MKSEEIKPQILELLRKDSYNVTELCRICNIDRSTYYDWLQDPKFKEDVNAARQEFLDNILADAKISLRKLVQGYVADETTIVTVPSDRVDINGNPIPKIKEQKVVKKPIPPNTGAVIFALTNLESESWKNRQVQDISAKVDAAVEETKRYDLSAVPDEELQRLADLIQESEHEKLKE